MHQILLFKFLVLHLFPEESLTDVPILLLLVKSFLTRVVYDHEFDHFNISPSEFLTSSFRPRSCSRARLLHLRASTRVPRYETKINNSSTESRSFSRKKLSRPINSANVLRPRELFYRLKLNSFPPFRYLSISFRRGWISVNEIPPANEISKRFPPRFQLAPPITWRQIILVKNVEYHGRGNEHEELRLARVRILKRGGRGERFNLTRGFTVPFSPANSIPPRSTKKQIVRVSLEMW